MANDEHALEAAHDVWHDAWHNAWGAETWYSQRVATALTVACRAYHKAMLAEAAPAASVSVAERVAALRAEARKVEVDADRELGATGSSANQKWVSERARAMALIREAYALERSE